MTTTRTRLNRCPRCNRKIDSATPISDRNVVPTPGDLSACWYCGEILVFTHDLSIRKVEAKDLEGVSDSAMEMLLRWSHRIRGSRN
jgi:hypothetical protein